MEKKSSSLLPIALVTLLEFLSGGVTVLGFFLFNKFDMTVLYGALLGAFAASVNFAALAFSTGRAVDSALAGFEGEHTEEEIQAFAAQNEATVKAKVGASQAVRLLTLFGALLLAFLLGKVFNVIATVIPLLLFRPLLILADAIGKKVSHG